VIALLLTVLGQAPVLYLSLAQQQQGEIDLLLVNRDRLLDFETANTTAQLGGLTYTCVLCVCVFFFSCFSDSPKKRYGCPRIIWDLFVSKPALCSGYTGPYDVGDCSGARGARATAFAIHDAAERRAALGRAWTRSGFNATAGIPAGGVFLSRALASSAGLAAEDTVLLSFALPDMLSPALWANLTAGLVRKRRGGLLRECFPLTLIPHSLASRRRPT